MVGFLIISLGILLVLYLLVRLFRNLSLEKRLTPTELLVAGLSAWGMILFWCWWFGLIIYSIVGLLMGSGEALIFAALMLFATGFVYRFSQALDSYNLVDFIREAMWFRPYASQPFVILDEVERKKIQQIHKETSNTAFPTIPSEKVLKTKEEVLKVQQEFLAFQRRPKKPLLLDDEMKELKVGHRVDISESWKLHILNRTSHDLYEEIDNMEIDPVTKILAFQVRIRSAVQDQLTNPILVFHIKQDLYDLLQAVHTEPWMRPYRPYYKTISLFCIGVMYDEYGRENLYPFMRIDIAVQELQQREGKFFSTTEFHKIARITFLDGNPIA
ncbi:MAG: hypothetical protein V1799_18255 [bacterium]